MLHIKLDVTISPEAEEDLRDILQYTYDTWGLEQMDKYANKLEKGLLSLAVYPKKGKVADNFRKGCRIFSVGKHLVFYRILESGIEISRVLSSKMDAKRHFQ